VTHRGFEISREIFAKAKRLSSWLGLRETSSDLVMVIIEERSPQDRRDLSEWLRLSGRKGTNTNS
jgi:hypothetical protein